MKVNLYIKRRCSLNHLMDKYFEGFEIFSEFSSHLTSEAALKAYDEYFVQQYLKYSRKGEPYWKIES